MITAMRVSMDVSEFGVLLAFAAAVGLVAGVFFRVRSKGR